MATALSSFRSLTHLVSKNSLDTIHNKILASGLPSTPLQNLAWSCHAFHVLHYYVPPYFEGIYHYSKNCTLYSLSTFLQTLDTTRPSYVKGFATCLLLHCPPPYLPNSQTVVHICRKDWPCFIPLCFICQHLKYLSNVYFRNIFPKYFLQNIFPHLNHSPSCVKQTPD